MSEQLRYCADVSDCANCKRWDKVCENKCVDNLLLMAADLIDEVTNGATVQGWISVKDERKPQHGDIALCYMTFGEYRLLQWDDGSKLWVGDYMDYGFEDAAYWQMPQPPKGE